MTPLRPCRRKRCRKPRNEHRTENGTYLCEDGQVFRQQAPRTSAASQSFKPGEIALGRKLFKSLMVNDHEIYSLAQDESFSSLVRKFQSMDKRLESLKTKERTE